MGHAAWFVNTGGTEVPLARGALAMGFGKATFKQGDDATLNQQSGHLYHITSCEELVYHNGSLKSVRAVINEKRNVEPKCSVAYHEMVEDP